MEELREVLWFCLLYAGALGAALAYTVKPGKVQALPLRASRTRRPDDDIF